MSEKIIAESILNLSIGCNVISALNQVEERLGLPLTVTVEEEA